MKTTLTSRLASLSFASLMTLAMLVSINTIATSDAPAHQLAAAASQAQSS